MTIAQGIKDNRYIIVSMDELPDTERRLETLGVTEKTVIELLNKKRNGAVIIRVRGTRFALGKAIAEGLKVRRCD